MSFCSASSFGSFLLAAVLLLPAACTRRTVYHTYQHTLVSGWEKNDTLCFHVPPLAHTGLYNEELALRINTSYPFTAVTLVVHQHVIPGGEEHIDTVNCRFGNRDDTRLARGISHFQYHFPITHLRLQEGDSLVVNVRHDMKRDILPGISDVGLKISSEK